MDEYIVAAGGGWLLLQALALWRLDGGWRMAAWVSAAVMAAAVAVAALGVMSGSNLAPIWVLFALPVCLAWIAALWIIRAVAWGVSR